MKRLGSVENLRKLQDYQQMNENELDSVITNLNSKLKGLENKYSNFVNHCADVIRDSRHSAEKRSASASSHL
jgi:hypothetical protein